MRQHPLFQSLDPPQLTAILQRMEELHFPLNQPDKREEHSLELYSLLDTMLQQQVPILHVLNVMNALYDRVKKGCVELAIQSMPSKPPTPFCFYLMGSAARKEQFLLTDQDHFLVYKEASAHEYFKTLSEHIVTNLEQAGYKKCTGDMMASNPKWRGSLSEWEERFQEWTFHTTSETLLFAQNFFSLRLLYGETSLHETFIQNSHRIFTKAQFFLYRLSQVERENPIPTLEQPIRSIFRLHKKSLDLKKEILFPFQHSLQILALMNKQIYGTPIEKLKRLHSNKILPESFQKDVESSISNILATHVKMRWNEKQAGKPITSTLALSNLTPREKEELILSTRYIKQLQSQMLSYF